MTSKAMRIAPIALGLLFSASVFAQTSGMGECPEPPSGQVGECKPLTRAEVKAELEAAGVKNIQMGECPEAFAGPTDEGKMRTRAEVRREAAEAAKTGKSIDMGACPR